MVKHNIQSRERFRKEENQKFKVISWMSSTRITNLQRRFVKNFEQQ